MPRSRVQLGHTIRNRFHAPVFGDECVCCNKHAMGRTQDYDPSTDRVTADSFAVPVCFDCKDHALQTHTVPILQACALLVGIAITYLGFHYRSERPDDSMTTGMAVVGILLTLGASFWIWKTHARDKRERELPGHFPRMTFSLGTGRALLDTTNGQLVDRLLAKNPVAKRLPTPLLWRKQEAKELAQARVVKREKKD